VTRGRARVAELEQQIGRFVHDHGAAVATQQGTIAVGSRAVTFQAAGERSSPRKHMLAGMTPEAAQAQRERGRVEAQLKLAIASESPEKPSVANEDLSEAKKELERKRIEFTERHPDVIRLQRTVERLSVLAPKAAGADPHVADLERQIREVDQRI